MLMVPGCFLLIYLLLFGALGSARDALLVFSAVPLALTGGVAALWLRGMPFSVSAAVAFIALSGIRYVNTANPAVVRPSSSPPLHPPPQHPILSPAPPSS